MRMSHHYNLRDSLSDQTLLQNFETFRFDVVPRWEFVVFEVFFCMGK